MSIVMNDTFGAPVFHARDQLDFMPITDQFEYPVKAVTFLEDIERNVSKFIDAYEGYKTR